MTSKNKDNIDTKLAFELVLSRALDIVQKKYGTGLDNKVLAGFLTTEIKEWFIVVVRLPRKPDVKKLIDALNLDGQDALTLKRR